ncbi:hypothetical protein I2W78_06460 [Streptomyces spinoverrucosus]|uniref:hypothetical protein n=1 Tax=Streptomyces spinoverrucosus TaxID=284043 RepID=UPI0018C3F7B3|nr:hypothetical protein [Streptomyces spinoverrucosus]MBG0851498.1 hypothetical protein [Streptomyces spinoverrucosus]
MPESLPVRCPACRREHLYTAPSYPCACGAPAGPPLDRHTAPRAVAHRSWDEEWVAVPCASCGRRNHWPRPELGCPCGTVLRIPVARPGTGDRRPVGVRTALDAVTAAALYLHRLGHRDLRRADQRPPSGIGLAARGLVAQVDPSARPATLRDVECLWLTAMSESARCVYFSLSGYATEARARADALGVPLFVVDDPTGTPRPVNQPADALHATLV